MTAPEALAVLAGHKFANLTTFRKTGQEVVTPVWFAQDGEKIYVMTMGSAGKVKRLRNNPAARLGPSDQSGKALGLQIDVRGRLLTPEESATARRALDAKYGLMKKLFDMTFAIRRAKMQQVYLEFTAS